MLRPIDNYFTEKEEPVKSCLQALRTMILSFDTNITETWKYGMPIYCYKGKMFCYLWTHKKYKQPYIGIVEGRRLHHAALMIEKRSRMKIMLLDAEEDLPIETINNILQVALDLYRNGAVKVK